MKKKSSSASFLKKTYDMLEQGESDDLVSWTDDGSIFVIKNVNEFSEKVLPKYFKHNNLASFVRQLNMYDFHKCRVSGIDHAFKHPLFLRGRLDLLEEIRRKNSEVNLPVEQRSTSSKAEISPLLQKLYQLHRRSQASDTEIQKLEEKVAELNEQNRALASQFWETKEKMRGIEQVLLMMATYIQSNGQDLPSQLFPRENNLPITHIPDTPKKRAKCGEEMDNFSSHSRDEGKNSKTSSNDGRKDDFEVDDFFSYQDLEDCGGENLDFLLDNKS